MIYMYNDVKLKNIYIDDKPYKKNINFTINNECIVKSVHYVDIMYKNKSLYVQIPKYKMIEYSEMDNSISICIDKYFYSCFIEPLETHIINIVYNNSEKLFSKKFTIDKISGCFVSNIEKNNILKLNVSESISIYNKNKQHVDLKNIQLQHDYLDVICILCVENLQFIDNLFTCNITVEQLRIYNEIETTLQKKIQTYNESSESSESNKKSKNSKSSETSFILEDEYFKESG